MLIASELSWQDTLLLADEYKYIQNLVESVPRLLLQYGQLDPGPRSPSEQLCEGDST